MPERTSQNAYSVAANAAASKVRARFIPLPCRYWPRRQRMPDRRRPVEDGAAGPGRLPAAVRRYGGDVAAPAHAPAPLEPRLGNRARLARRRLGALFLLVDPRAPQPYDRHHE